MDRERIIVSFTSWEKRFCNIPYVLDTIFNQSLPPDIVVLNLNDDEIIPHSVNEYLGLHNVIVNRTPYKKVFKKIIPTLKLYPDDCIINIDDDWLYPPTMIEDFWNTHLKYQNNPISGNREFINGYTCHCGCASLTKAPFFDNLELIDQDLMEHCPSDDAVYTYFAIRSGHPYLWAKELYYTNMQSYNSIESYSPSDSILDAVGISWQYLISRFGEVQPLEELLIQDKMILNILQRKNKFEISKAIIEGRSSIRSSMAYKTGNILLKPFLWISNLKGKTKTYM